MSDDIADMLAEDPPKSGGRVPHLDRFLDHVSPEHAEQLRRALRDETNQTAQLYRVIKRLRREHYPDFGYGISERAVHGWRVRNL